MPTMSSAVLRPVLFGSFLALSTLGCSDLGTHNLAIEASEAVTAGVITTDGWTVTFSQLVVVVHDPGLIERVDNEPTWVREQGSSVWDVSQAPAEGDPLSRDIRATRYDGADFRIAPTSNSAYPPVAGNVDEATVDAAIDGGWSIHVVGSATDANDVTIAFDWTFDTSTLFRCEFDDDDALELAADGDETTTIEILGEALLRDGGVATAELAFGWIAAADANQDGTVSNDELDSASLGEAISNATRRLGGVRGVGACPVIDPRPNQ